MSKVVAKITTVRIYDSEEEYQAFITDLENSKQFEFKHIINLRNKADLFISAEEQGYFGKKNKISTLFEFS